MPALVHASGLRPTTLKENTNEAAGLATPLAARAGAFSPDRVGRCARIPSIGSRTESNKLRAQLQRSRHSERPQRRGEAAPCAFWPIRRRLPHDPRQAGATNPRASLLRSQIPICAASLEAVEAGVCLRQCRPSYNLWQPRSRRAGRDQSVDLATPAARTGRERTSLQLASRSATHGRTPARSGAPSRAMPGAQRRGREPLGGRLEQRHLVSCRIFSLLDAMAAAARAASAAPGPPPSAQTRPPTMHGRHHGRVAACRSPSTVSRAAREAQAIWRDAPGSNTSADLFDCRPS